MSDGKITRQELSIDLNGDLDKIGNLSQLQTTDKSSLVNANNEIKNNLTAHLNDYTQFKEELTQPDTLATPKQISPIISLPNAIDGQASVGVDGRTYTNIVKNGNFANGTSGWFSVSTSSLTVINNELSFTPTAQYGKIAQSIKAQIGDKLFISMIIKTNSNTVNTGVSYKLGYSAGSASYAGSGNYERLTFLATIPSDVVPSELQVLIQDSGTSGWTEIKVKEVIIVNLTALGDTETDVDILAQKYPYISGTKSTTNTRIKSVGKNLFDGEMELGIYSISTGQKTPHDTRTRCKNKIKVSPNTNYTLKNINTVTGVYVLTYDRMGNFIEYIGYGEGTKIFTTNSNVHFITFYTLDANLSSNYQLEEGSTATPYEPYKESISYITLPEGVDGLHSLPNKVKDEVPPGGDLIKRAKEYVLQESNIGTIVTGLTSFDSINIIKPPDMAEFTSESSGQALLEGYITGIGINGDNFDSPQNVNMLIAATSVSVGGLVTTFPKGTYANTTEAQQALAGTKIIYQLAEPQIYDLAVTPVTCFENGIIYIESADDAQEYVVPETQFTYPINTAGAIQSNVEGINELGNLVITRIIEESGSNANGEYIRFADGTQICSIFSKALQNAGINSMELTFPAIFINNNITIVVSSSGDNINDALSDKIVVKHNSVTTSDFTVFYDRNANSFGYMRYIAIGRWK